MRYRTRVYKGTSCRYLPRGQYLLQAVIYAPPNPAAEVFPMRNNARVTLFDPSFYGPASYLFIPLPVFQLPRPPFFCPGPSFFLFLLASLLCVPLFFVPPSTPLTLPYPSSSCCIFTACRPLQPLFYTPGSSLSFFFLHPLPCVALFPLPSTSVALGSVSLNLSVARHTHNKGFEGVWGISLGSSMVLAVL